MKQIPTVLLLVVLVFTTLSSSSSSTVVTVNNSICLCVRWYGTHAQNAVDIQASCRYLSNSPPRELQDVVLTTGTTSSSAVIPVVHYGTGIHLLAFIRL